MVVSPVLFLGGIVLALWYLVFRHGPGHERKLREYDVEQRVLRLKNGTTVTSVTCRKCGREIAPASELCMHCGAYRYKTNKPHHRKIFLVVGHSASVAFFLTVVVVGEPQWLDFQVVPFFLPFVVMIVGILTTFALSYEFYGGGNSWDGDYAKAPKWSEPFNKWLNIEAPAFDEKQKVMRCPEGREVPFSDITIHIESLPDAYGPSEEGLLRHLHCVYALAGSDRFDLDSFTSIRQAKEFAREIRKKVATGKCGTIWFPPDE